jgi:RecA-family ATPase
MRADHWQRVSFLAARDGAAPEIDFCLTNLLAGTVGVVAAPAGIGKTSLLMQMGAAVAAGIPVAGDLLPAPEKAGSVTFLAMEDPHPILMRRAHHLVRSLAAQGHGDETVERLERNLHIYSLKGPAPILLNDATLSTSALDRIEAFARDARLLILDPIRRFHHCDEQNYGRMALLFGVLSTMAATTGCTIVFAHHVDQPKIQADLGEPEGARGSSAFINSTRWVVNMNGMSLEEAVRYGVAPAQRRDYVRVGFTKSNYGPPLAARWLKRSQTFEGILEPCNLAVQESVATPT